MAFENTELLNILFKTLSCVNAHQECFVNRPTKRRRMRMTRTLAVIFVIALSCTLISACACMETDRKKCTELCQAALDKAKATEQFCSNSLRASEGAVMKAESTARRAEQAADKAEAILKMHLKK
jgi:hypothetical protein